MKEILNRISELEDYNRRLKAEVQQHPANVTLERNDASNMAYIYSFSNAIKSVHRVGDLEGARTAMKEMLISYMRNNHVQAENHLPIKDLTAFGMDFGFLPPDMKFYDPEELLQMGVEAEGSDSNVEEAEGGVDDGDGSGKVACEEQVGNGGDQARVEIPEVEQHVTTNLIEGTSDTPQL